MPPQRSVLVLAGGLGTRLRDLCPNLPKPMVPVGGKPFLDYILEFWRAQGASHFVLSTGHLGHVIEDHYARSKDVVCVREKTPQGTGGAIRFAVQRAELSDPFVTANGDSLVVADFRSFWDLQPEAAASLAAVNVADTSRFGRIATDGRGYLRAFEEKRSGSGAVNAGVYCLRHSFAAMLPTGHSSLEVDVLPTFLKAGVLIKVHSVDGHFIDIGTPASLPDAAEFVRRHVENIRP